MLRDTKWTNRIFIKIILIKGSMPLKSIKKTKWFTVLECFVKNPPNK